MGNTNQIYVKYGYIRSVHLNSNTSTKSKDLSLRVEDY